MPSSRISTTGRWKSPGITPRTEYAGLAGAIYIIPAQSCKGRPSSFKGIDTTSGTLERMKYFSW